MGNEDLPRRGQPDQDSIPDSLVNTISAQFTEALDGVEFNTPRANAFIDFVDIMAAYIEVFGNPSDMNKLTYALRTETSRVEGKTSQEYVEAGFRYTKMVEIPGMKPIEVYRRTYDALYGIKMKKFYPNIPQEGK